MDRALKTRSSMKGSIDYLLLFFVILFAVIIGDLASDWIKLKWFERRLVEVASALVEEQDQAKRARDQEVRSGRIESTKGKQLQIACRDWTRAYSETGSITARDGQRKHCGDYHAFIETGRVQ